jgi:hypothetical protein
LWCSVSFVRAENKIDIPVAPDGKIDNLLPVICPQSRCVAPSDTHGWLAFGHRLQHQEYQVSLFKLDGEGRPATEPVTLKLPRPEALSKYPQQVLSLAFHPKLPLLYVWQEIELPKNEQRFTLPLTPADQEAMNQFDHLAVYNVDKSPPELLVSLCRLPDFAYSRPAGGIGVDPAAERLYVPNIRNPKAAAQSVMGSYVLDPDGLPMIGAETEVRGSVAERVARINDAKTAGKPPAPQRVAPFNQETFETEIPLGMGHGYVHIAPDFVLCGGIHTSGVLTWQPENRRVRLHGFLLPNPYRTYWVVGHPRLPVVFVGDPGTPWAYRFEHADGYLTMIPQKAAFAGVNLSSGPVVCAKTNQVAFGASGWVILAKLDDEGRFTTQRTQMRVDNPTPEAVAYSDKFDRLYVAVEKKK